MKSFVILSTVLFGIVGSVYSSYEILRVKNIRQYLEWQGYSLINSENSWKAIYEENSIDFDSIKDLRTYCNRVLASNNFKELFSVVKYCVDKPETLRGVLIKEGLFNKLINTDEDYKIALALREENTEFLNLISSNIVRFKEWCENSLNKKANFALVRNVKTFCIAKPYKTADEKLKYEGLERLGKEELSTKFNELGIQGLGDNVGHTLLIDISKKEDWATLKKDKEKFTNVLWNYCEKEAKRKLSDEGFYTLGYSKFRTRCANIEPLKVILKKQEEVKNNPLVKEISNIEKENKCNIYFVLKHNQNFRADDLIWLDIQKQSEFRHRNLYQEFKDFAVSEKAIELCKNADGQQVNVQYGYWTGKWG